MKVLYLFLIFLISLNARVINFKGLNGGGAGANAGGLNTPTLYSKDGSLTENRTINTNGKTITIKGTNYASLILKGVGANAGGLRFGSSNSNKDVWLYGKSGSLFIWSDISNKEALIYDAGIDTFKLNCYARFDRGIKDANNKLGDNGQVLTKENNKIIWKSPTNSKTISFLSYNNIDRKLTVFYEDGNTTDVTLTPTPHEDWHIVGAKGEPQFENGVSNYSSSFTPLRFKKVNGVVWVQGVVKDYIKDKVIFTIPAGYRPSKKMLTKQIKMGGKVCRVDIVENGQFTTKCSKHGYLTLNISYLVD